MCLLHQVLFPEKDNASYIVWFRDPIERTISHYYYLRLVMRDPHFVDTLRMKLGLFVDLIPMDAILCLPY